MLSLALVISSGAVVLSAPIAPISHPSQGEIKGDKHDPCAKATKRPGVSLTGTQNRQECAEGRQLSHAEQLRPYTAGFELESTHTVLGLSCDQTAECGSAVLDPVGHGSKGQVPIVPLSLGFDDTERFETVLTVGHGESLMKTSRTDFTKLITERDDFLQMGAASDGQAATGGGKVIFWDRLLNLGPLLLLLFEKLLGRL
jgi:hypothetical protein